jgi:hypothetical protein
MSILLPVLSSSPPYGDIGYHYSWVGIENDQNRPMYAQASYNINNGNNYLNISNSTIGTSNGTVLLKNLVRKALYIRNMSTEILYIKYGEGASDTSFNVTLRGDPNEEGLGDVMFDDQVYQGIVSVYSTDPKYMIWEGW